MGGLQDPEDGVWSEHVPALEAFLAVATQWRLSGMGRPVGLDYTAARAGFDLAGITVSPALWEQVQAIEHGALAALNEDNA